MRKGNKSVQRGEIYFADLSPAVGSEQGGLRPVLILQNNVGNRNSPTVIVAAITGRKKKRLPTHVQIGRIERLYKKSVVLLEQIRTIDQSRLGDCVGRVSKQRMDAVDRALTISVGLDSEYL